MNKLRIRVTAQLDGKIINPNESFETEKIGIIFGDAKEIENTFAIKFAKQNNIQLKKQNISGVCAAYYYQRNNVDEEYVNQTIKSAIELKKRSINLEFIQIDAGYCKWGDWLDFNDKFPNGMKNIAKKIDENGFSAGIWFAPYCATKDSKLFHEHPDWFIKINEKPLQARNTSPFDNIDLLGLYVLNPLLLEVKEYLRDYISKYRDWGFKLMKLDFLYTLAYIPTEITNMTRAELLNQCIEFIKDVAGADVSLLSGISQLSPLAGMVDFVRTGIDTTNPFMYELPLISNVVNNKMLNDGFDSYSNRQFLNRHLWIADSDCLVLNKKAGLSKSSLVKHHEILKHSDSKWLGDKLSIYAENDFKMLKQINFCKP